MRKLFAILVLTVLCVEITGFYFLFLFQRRQIKAEMRASLQHHSPNGDLAVFAFELKNGKPVDKSFAWKEKHEFRFKGTMYDVISSEIKGDTLHIRAIDDVRETALLKKFSDDLERTLEGKPGSTPSKTNLLLKIWTGQDLPPLPLAFILPGSDYKKLYHTSQYTCTDRFLEVQTPPPRIV